jgi:hypothetical protein
MLQPFGLPCKSVQFKAFQRPWQTQLVGAFVISLWRLGSHPLP